MTLLVTVNIKHIGNVAFINIISKVPSLILLKTTDQAKNALAYYLLRQIVNYKCKYLYDVGPLF